MVGSSPFSFGFSLETRPDPIATLQTEINSPFPSIPVLHMMRHCATLICSKAARLCHLVLCKCYGTV